MLIIIIASFMAQLCFFSLRERLKRRRANKKKEIEDLIDKYVVEEKKSLMRQKLSKVFELIAKTEEYIERIVRKKVKVAEDYYEFKKDERDLIRKAKLEYDLFISEFKSALPQTEKQRLLDMQELKNAISILESFDAENYETEERGGDAGTGIFYDKMSRKFMYIIDKNKLMKYDFVPIQMIKYHAFSDIKNIKDNDILPVLNIMKETNLINDILEINPQFQILVFNEDKKIELSIPEKVVLSFTYDEESLTLQKLIELTEWKEDYANKIINELIKREIISIQNDQITVKSFGSSNERKAWNSLIEAKIEQEKEKEEKIFKKQKERAAQLKEKLAKVEKIHVVEKNEDEDELKEIQFKEKPSVKILPSIKEKYTSDEDLRKKNGQGNTIAALDEIKPTKTPLAKVSEEIKIESQQLEDLVPEKILQYHENFSLVNGGFSQYEKIKSFIDQELENVPEDLLIKMLEQLKELQLIHDSIKIKNYNFYLFNEIFLTDREIDFIGFAINKKPMTKEEFIHGLYWDEEKILFTMKSLQEKKILRIEQNCIIIPGIIQLV